MPRRLWLLALLFLSSAVPAQDSVPRLEVAFEVDVTRPDTGAVHVVMKILNNTAEHVDVAIPCWSPGSYRLLNYYEGIKNVTSPGGVSAVDKMTWRIQARGSTVTVEYDVEATRSRESRVHSDGEHCYLEGPATYFYVVGHKEAPCSVRFQIPEGWKIATGLESRDGGYAARDYDTFADCPTEIGKFDLHEFREDGALYQIAVHSVGKYDGEGLVEVCRKIVHEQNSMFGPLPFERYVFLLHFKKSFGGGGLEHLNSTNITLSYDYVKSNIRNAAGIISHEYFHLWNVKRIRPKELGPFAYGQIVRSRHLWFCEGVTSYFGDRALVRAGLWDEPTYFTHLKSEIESHNNNPDRKVTSVERASEGVWDRKDFPRVDYYNKGECLGLLLDLRIRTLTENRKSLDDVLRRLYTQYVVEPSKRGDGPIGVGFGENGILEAINEVSGHDFTDFYSNYIRGTEELPFERTLADAGLDVKLAVRRAPDLKIPLRGFAVTQVDKGSALESAGVQVGDRLTKINGVEVTRQSLPREVDRLGIGKEAKLTFVRGEKSFDVAWKVESLDERCRCETLQRSAKPTEVQKRILDSWLGKR